VGLSKITHLVVATKKQVAKIRNVKEKQAGKNMDRIEKQVMKLTFSNFSMVRLSIPPHW